MNRSPDAVAGGAHSATIAGILAWPIVCCRCDARQIGWDLGYGAALMEHERARPAQAAHEQAQFKYDIVAWPERCHVTATHPIVGGQHQHPEVKAWERIEQRFNKRTPELEKPIIPDRNLHVRLY